MIRQTSVGCPTGPRVGLVSGTSVAYDARMASSPVPESPTVAAPRDAGVTPPGAGLGATIADRIDLEQFRAALAGVVYFLARCRRCGIGHGIDTEPLTEPFRDETERDQWAAQHCTNTGHVVSVTVDGLDGIPDLHMTGIITRDENQQFRFVCPAEVCGTSCGPFDTASLAIASWRTHKPSVKAPQ